MAEGRIRLMLQKRAPVNIEFADLTYTVPISRTGSKIILRGVSGLFKSGELTAIMGPSGAGKSTLLNVLAGYRSQEASGQVLINGMPREMRQFRKTSRYIMQEDLLHPNLTVREAMLFAAHLKLGNSFCTKTKSAMIEEIAEELRLSRCLDTRTCRLSGGERKRLSIAVELVNNPAVIFLDEPTTGLDDSSSVQCLSVLKDIAKGGRSVICSIHTPSAKIFAMFDNVYIVSEGQCVFQGHGEDIVYYLSTHGLDCPKHYNPADFMIEVSSGEYGDYTERMVAAIENGKCQRWNKLVHPIKYNRQDSELEMQKVKQLPDYGCGTIGQFFILLHRMFLSQFREINNILLKAFLQALIGLLIGVLYYKMGNDASKTIFNFGFCFVTVIDFMYIPMLPTLAWFPQEVLLLKREHFNRWYNLNSYFLALTIAKIPKQLLIGSTYLVIAYAMSDQPLEPMRVIKFFAMCYLLGQASESMSLAISARLNIVNGIFLGPALSVPFMLLAVYGMGSPLETIPTLVRIAMNGSYLRWGLEGLVSAIYGTGRSQLLCPDEVVICDIKEPRALLKLVGMEHADYWTAFGAIIVYILLFKLVAYLLLKQRLSRNKKLGALGLVGQFVKTNFNLSHS